MLGQKRVRTTRGQQFPGQRLYIQKPALGILNTLHESILNDPDTKPDRRALNP